MWPTVYLSGFPSVCSPDFISFEQNKTRNVSIGHGCPHFRFFATAIKSHNEYSG